VAIPSGKLGGLQYTALSSPQVLSDGTNTFTTRVGISNNNFAGVGTAFVGFRYTHGTNSGNYQCVCRTGGVETVINTAVAPTVYNNVTQAIDHLRFEVNAGGTSVEFFINNVSMGAITTNIPTAVLLSYTGHGIIKSAGTTGRYNIMLFQSLRVTR